MKVLIIRTDINVDSFGGRALSGVDTAVSSELYHKYRINSNVGGDWSSPLNRLTANHIWDKYTFIDEKCAYIGTFKSIDEVLEKNPFMGNVLILTHEQWLDKQNPEWRTVPRYQYF